MPNLTLHTQLGFYNWGCFAQNLPQTFWKKLPALPACRFHTPQQRTDVGGAAQVQKLGQPSLGLLGSVGPRFQGPRIGPRFPRAIT